MINEYQIQKSKFITYLFQVVSLDQVNKYLEQVRREHPNATHHCYSYILEQQKRCSDDGEPSGTAGMPMLNVLEKQNLDYILCVVVRYFGGILLGAGGLVRAYTTSVTNALEKANYVDILPGKEVTLAFSYEQKQNIDMILKNANILEQQYLDVVQYLISISNTNWDQIKHQLRPYLLEEPILQNAYYIEKEN